MTAQLNMIFQNARLIFPDGIRDGLEVVVELDTFGLYGRRTFDYDEVFESTFVNFPFPPFLV